MTSRTRTKYQFTAITTVNDNTKSHPITIKRLTLFASTTATSITARVSLAALTSARRNVT